MSSGFEWRSVNGKENTKKMNENIHKIPKKPMRIGYVGKNTNWKRPKKSAGKNIVLQYCKEIGLKHSGTLDQTESYQQFGIKINMYITKYGKEWENNKKKSEMSNILREKRSSYEETEKLRWKIQFNIEKIFLMHYGKLDRTEENHSINQ